jgi:hypothetical protein
LKVFKQKERVMRKLTSMGVPAVLAAALSLSVYAQTAEHDHNHPEGVPAQQSGPAKPAPKVAEGASTGGMMDMKSMCDMHKQMMGAKSDDERQAMMDKRMKGMSSELREKQMQMMNEQCK